MDEAAGPADDDHDASGADGNGDGEGADGDVNGHDSDERMPPRDSALHPDRAEADAAERLVDPKPGNEDEDEDETADGNVAGSLAPEVPVEPGRPEPFNVAFVVIGAYIGVLGIAGFVGGVGQFTLVDYGWISLGYLALAGIAYAFFARTNPDT